MEGARELEDEKTPGDFISREGKAVSRYVLICTRKTGNHQWSRESDTRELPPVGWGIARASDQSVLAVIVITQQGPSRKTCVFCVCVLGGGRCDKPASPAQDHSVDGICKTCC